MITGGRNAGRVGVIQRREKHIGLVRDRPRARTPRGISLPRARPTCSSIGDGNKPMVSLPKGKGIKLSIVDERH